VRVKLDENLPHELSSALRRHGHDVHTVVEEHIAGEDDPVVVAAARRRAECCSPSTAVSATCGAIHPAAMPGSSSCARLHKIQTASWPSYNV
jgi:hypothetical protein